MSVQSVALASLTAAYTDSEDEDTLDSDLQENSNTPRGATPQNVEIGQLQDPSPKSDSSTLNSPINTLNNSNKNNNLPIPNDYNLTPVKDVTSKVQRLVSYFDDTIVSDDEEAAVETPQMVSSLNGSSPLDTVEQQPPDCQEDSVSDGEADEYGVIIPPEPSEPCPVELQEKIQKLYKKMESGNLDMNNLIQQRKDFRNPSIYEKLIQFCTIDELGTNYSPDRFDPFKWNKDSYYEELAKIQKVKMEKLEKSRKEKTKIEIVSGTAKQPNIVTKVEDDSKKRKSKWDQAALNLTMTVTAKPGIVVVTQPTLTTLTSTVNNIQATLPKKRL